MGEDTYPTLQLSQRVGQQWSNIEATRSVSNQKLAELQDTLIDLDSEDTSIVVLGSLGRKEFTSDSDIDWNLLVDGIADPNHHTLFLDIQKKVQSLAMKQPGREGTFGTFVSSHDLIHKIGGEDDTNRNLTRRLLLLLESTPVGRPTAHERVIKNILKRYLFEDRSFWRGSGHGHHIPHFLLNDFARLWRTFAVDFAYKLRARSGEGWAIRNIKLRMSRKLLYVAGLLGCFRLHFGLSKEDQPAMFGEEGNRPEILDILFETFSETPLDIVARFLMDQNLHETASELFGAYDEFLAILLDSDSRTHLEKLKEGAGDADHLYQKARKMSHRFRDALLDLFFDQDTDIRMLTRLYGVF
jgi:predicted nucleotidyltransferase